MTNFKPKHLNAETSDLAGNDGIGRYVFLPGSDGRAQQIAEHFSDLKIKRHPRGHHLYLGTLSNGDKVIDVATVASGMGCPSMEIILHELFSLGAKRFLRVGTAGTLQPHAIKIGDLVNAQASVRDETTTTDYVPVALPAIASLEFTAAISHSAKTLALLERLHTGVVHCKSSFYAREFGIGPQAENNKSYLNMLSQSGVLATEMETAALFIQSQLFDHQLKVNGKGPQHRVFAGAVLAIVGTLTGLSANEEEYKNTITDLIKLSLETVKLLAENNI